MILQVIEKQKQELAYLLSFACHCSVHFFSSRSRNDTSIYVYIFTLFYVISDYPARFFVRGLDLDSFIYT